MKIGIGAIEYIGYYDKDGNNILREAWDSFEHDGFHGSMHFRYLEIKNNKLFANLNAYVFDGKEERYQVKISGEISPETGHFIKKADVNWIKI